MPLDQDQLGSDPILAFKRWYEEASASGTPQPDAMALATATRDGAPSARMVLLKHVDYRGIVFVTHYRSRKAEEIETNPRVALLWYWPSLHRQVRIEGRAARVSTSESDALFDARPLASRMSAIASPQSQAVPDRADLERRVREVVARYRHDHATVPRPDDWGGYRVSPSAIEFWQSGPNRLHDRLHYRRAAGAWVVERLAP